MADIKPTAQNLLNSLLNDGKSRSVLEGGDHGDLAGQFSEVMLSRLGNFSGNLNAKDQDMRAYLKKITQQAALRQTGTVDRPAETTSSSAARKTADGQPVEQARATDAKTAIRERIELIVKELSEKHDLPVEDTQSLEAMQKLARFLLKADKEGLIDLPPELTSRMEAFLLKGDTFNAYDIALFMRDFVESFRDVRVAFPAGQTPIDGLEWPEDVTAAFEALGLPGLTDKDKPLTLVDILRSLKALANESENAAKDTIDGKLNKVLLAPEQLLEQAAETPVKTVPQDTITAEDQAAKELADLLAPKTDAALPPEAAAVIQALANPTIPANAETALSVDSQTIAENLAAGNAALATTLAGKKDTQNQKQDNASPVWASQLPGMAATDAASATGNDRPSLSEMALNAAFPQKNNDARKESGDGKSAASTSAESSQLKQVIIQNAAAPVAAGLSPVTDKAVDQLTQGIAGPGQIDALSASARQAVRAATSPAAQLPSPATQQVIAQIRQQANRSTEITVQLTPAELGRVEVRLQIQRDGQVHAIVIADKPETLALLQKDSGQLERSLQQAGLNANSENMNFNLRDQQQAQQFGQGRKRFSRDSITDDKVADIAVNVAAETSIITDNRVNYHA